jgi:hypothetical protein
MSPSPEKPIPVNDQNATVPSQMVTVVETWSLKIKALLVGYFRLDWKITKRFDK